MSDAVTPAVEEVSGRVEKVIFYDKENGFCVIAVQAPKPHNAKATQRIVVTGHAFAISVGDSIQASGSWIEDKKHGLRFQTNFLKILLPTTLEGIERYLGSGLIKGIGPVYAKKLIEAFGETIFDVIDNQPDRLKEVPGIGPSKVEKILSGWEDQKSIRDIMVFLHSHQISTEKAVRIFKVYGPKAVQIITKNPYQLARDIKGIGFISADKIAQTSGVDKQSPLRLGAGLSYVLAKAMEQGHCGLPKDKLLEDCQKLLDIDENLITDTIKKALTYKDIVQDVIDQTDCVFLRGMAMAEENIATRLLTLKEGHIPWKPWLGEQILQKMEETSTLSLSDSQRNAVFKAISSKVLIITGGPGVGKTTIINVILDVLKNQNIEIALAAPTGRAAKRLCESTGMEAKTLHRLLETNPQDGGFFRKEDKPLTCDLLVVDEVSMVDVPLMNAMLRALPDKAALLLIGDADQLPSVGPGQALADLIDSHVIPVVRLTDIFRQSVHSQIVANSHKVNQGIMPTINDYSGQSDFHFIEVDDPDQALTTLIKLVTEVIPRQFGLCVAKDIQVLCPMTKGTIGTKTINTEIQKVLNPPTEQSLQSFGWSYSVGDKVMQIQNNYQKDVYNGDLGVISTINMEEGDLTITFDGRSVLYDFTDLDEIVLAYATTIHKSQGSEYACVVIPLLTQHYIMLQRKLLYTAITRGKKLVVIIGQKKALFIAVQQNADRKRWSSLRKRLVESQGLETPLYF
jgi:exodeoxyribonuclease V alpha subunit